MGEELNFYKEVAQVTGSIWASLTVFSTVLGHPRQLFVVLCSYWGIVIEKK
jgi:hypothetical protein